MKYKNIREEELKNKVGADWFNVFDTTEILGNIDFTVFPKQDSIFGRIPLLWAEAKTGDFDLITMFVQLVLTIGKARTFDKTLPPAFIGAFDFRKIAFVPYISIQDIFYLNDFNWNVTPSNHDTKEFKLIKDRIEVTLQSNSYVYDYQTDEAALRTFIANNIAKATEASKIKIDKNNFIPIYLRWLDIIKPNIDVNWDELKKANILDSDFYLADLFVDDKDTNKIDDDSSIRDSLFVVFQNQGYKIAKENIKQMFDAAINLKNKETYQQFWKRYKRPPLTTFQDYIIERRDLLVPQDIRERKGAFFTPRIWVELSQKYLTDYLGENWQEDYYVWDCAAGTGNLLAGLTNKYNLWASTLDQADVKVMHERIEHGANLLENHVFQFDFLNDDFSKLPQGLQDIINDKNKRKKLVIYINPPYAEATSAKTVTGTGENKSGVAKNNKIREFYRSKINGASNEMFALFMERIYDQIPNVILAQFSTLKFIQSTNFIRFKEYFLAKYLGGFVVRADSFDNVKGSFPIGFTVWDTNTKQKIKRVDCQIFQNNGIKEGNKTFYGELPESINQWLTNYYKNNTESEIATLSTRGNDFQNQKYIYLATKIDNEVHDTKVPIFNKTLISIGVYFSVRHCIKATWLNDRDQFLRPNDGWERDTVFQNDCLAFTLFNSQNKISATDGINHWIPFTEQEVNAKEKFESSFMTDFIKSPPAPRGGVQTTDLFSQNTQTIKTPTLGLSAERERIDNFQKVVNSKLVFSAEATAVFDAGRELWKYYHSQNDNNANASFYDIREYFQGRNPTTGRMNNKSTDEKYTTLIADLREQLNTLADKIKPKIYEYEFLKA